MPEDVRPNDKFALGERVWVELVKWGCDQGDCNCYKMGIRDGKHAVMIHTRGTITGVDPCSFHRPWICTLDTAHVTLDRYRWYHYLWPWRPLRKIKAGSLQKLTVLERLADA